MASPAQNYQNHTRIFPLFHYVVLPIFLLNFLYMARHVYQRPSVATVMALLVALGLMLLALTARIMALTVQDRVIRLEMQLRLLRILPPEMQKHIAALERGHFVALRFAGDEELADLIRDVAEGRLRTAKEIKLRVKNWQADWLRA